MRVFTVMEQGSLLDLVTEEGLPGPLIAFLLETHSRPAHMRPLVCGLPKRMEKWMVDLSSEEEWKGYIDAFRCHRT